MEGDDEHQQDLAGLAVGGAEDGVEVAEQEADGEAEADADEDPVEHVDAGPADQRHGDPDQVAVPVQRPALQQVRRLRPEVPQRPEQHHRDGERVPVDETGGACLFFGNSRVSISDTY